MKKLNKSQREGVGGKGGGGGRMSIFSGFIRHEFTRALRSGQVKCYFWMSLIS